MKKEAVIYVDLAPGKCAEVVVRVVEEGLPTPLEGCSFREPTVSEMDEITSRVWAERYDSKPPFEIERPHWPKPMHEETQDLKTRDARLEPGLPAHTARPWWQKILNR